MTHQASQQPFLVLPTIDTEGVHGRRPFEQFARGEIGLDEDWGALRIARIFNEYGVTGTFFVDVYEHTLFGEQPVADLCTALVQLGQDVQLHTHPSWRDDPRDFPELRALKRTNFYQPQHQDFMAKLDAERQAHVLHDGMRLLDKWIGQRPIAHRSGGYSIDGNTIVALKEVGIPIDSSMNTSHRNSRITWSRNQIVERDGVVEFPVTVARATAGVRGLDIYGRNLKTDINVLNASHMKEFCIQGRASGLRFINYFMHSYSLLKYSNNFDKIDPDLTVERDMRKFLEWATSTSWISVIDFKRVHALLNGPDFDRGQSDYVPVLSDNALILRKGLRTVASKLNLTES
jgi:hypothetical protein